LSTNDTAWCFGCNEKQGYKVYAQNAVTQINGVNVVHMKYTAQCAKCGREVSVDWVDELNYKSQVEARDCAKRRCAKGD
jgi:hypothetical protein